MARGSALIIFSDRVKKGQPGPWTEEDRNNIEPCNAIVNAKRTKRGNFPKTGSESFINALLQKSREGTQGPCSIIELGPQRMRGANYLAVGRTDNGKLELNPCRSPFQGVNLLRPLDLSPVSFDDLELQGNR